MSEQTPRVLPEGFQQGPVQGLNVIGETTEALHRWILDGWKFTTPPPRIEEDLSFVPKDREEVVYIYMYRAAHNTNLQNSKQWRPAKISLHGSNRSAEQIYYERAPLYLNLFYLIAVHSKFRSDAERLLGWLLMRLHDATHLVYRPRKYILPDGSAVDSTGAPWGVENDGDEVIMEKISMSLCDDLTIGDAVNFFTISEAPFRPYLTYRAQCAMEGPLIAGPPTQVLHHRTRLVGAEPPDSRQNGRITGRVPGQTPTQPTQPQQQPKSHIGPPGFGHRPIEDNESED